MNNSSSVPPTPFESRIQALQKRVNEAADALHTKGIKPTVQRIRVALGGGSPNDLTPALKHWRDEILPTLQTVESNATGIPSQVADLARELWTRALAAAEVDRNAGPAAIARIARSEEGHALREQIRELRDQLEKEAVRYGELRAQAARHEAIAKEALGRANEVARRERGALEELGIAKQQLVALRMSVAQTRTPVKRGSTKSPGPPSIKSRIRKRSRAEKKPTTLKRPGKRNGR